MHGANPSDQPTAPVPAPIPAPIIALSRGQLADRCRKAGLKATPQRLAIFQALRASKQHPSPEAVYGTVRAELPSISLATVYKTLETLAEAGLIKQVGQLVETRRYDANEQPHHHLVCTDCGSITDFFDPALDFAADRTEDGRLNLPLPHSLEGFEAREMQIQILGRCSTCSGQTQGEKHG